MLTQESGSEYDASNPDFEFRQTPSHGGENDLVPTVAPPVRPDVEMVSTQAPDAPAFGHALSRFSSV
jgi:hypothetical protein